VKKDAQEVESISNMLDKLKDTLGAIKPTIESKNQLKESSNKNVNKPRKEVINGNENVNLVSSKVISNKDLQGNSKKPSGDIKTNITENDLHSLSEIIIKLDELLRSNKELSDKLSDLIKEQKESNRNVNNSRTNELIRRLAYMGTNIN
jgi:multidrug efflux pump subunit AcrB